MFSRLFITTLFAFGLSHLAYAAAGDVVKTIGPRVAAKTADYTVTTADGLSYIVASGSGTDITLPAPGSNIGRQITVERSDATNSICVKFASNSDTVDGIAYQPSGTTSFCLNQGDKATFAAYAANQWKVVSYQAASTTAWKNNLINGNMDFWQRGTGFATMADGVYGADRWKVIQGTTAGRADLNQRAYSSYPLEGSTYFASYENSVTDTTVDATDLYNVCQVVEGNNAKSLYGKTSTLSFYVRTGQWKDGGGTNVTFPITVPVSVRTGNGDYSFVSTVSINAPTTWERKSVTIAPLTVGTRNRDNTAGLWVCFNLMGGSTYQTSTLNSWVSGNYHSHSTATNKFLSNTSGGNIFILSQVQLNEGPIAAPFQLAGGTIGGELALAQRYYEKSYDIGTTPGTNTANGIVVFWGNTSIPDATVIGGIRYSVKKRVNNTPTLLPQTGGGSTSTCSDGNGNSFPTNAHGAVNVGDSGFMVRNNSGVSQLPAAGFRCHFVVDAEL